MRVVSRVCESCRRELPARVSQVSCSVTVGLIVSLRVAFLDLSRSRLCCQFHVCSVIEQFCVRVSFMTKRHGRSQSREFVTTLLSNKRVKWTRGGGGKWHYNESADTFTKAWKTSYPAIWVDPETGWAYNVVWYLYDLIWTDDDVLEVWSWYYVVAS